MCDRWRKVPQVPFVPRLAGEGREWVGQARNEDKEILMNSNDKRRIMTKAGSATTAAGYAEAWGDLEQTVDQAAERIKNEYSSSEERIRSARYRPDEQRKQLTEARAYAADRLQTLRTDYETTREDLFSVAVHRAFSSGSLIGSDAVNRRDAVMRAASVEGPGEAQEMLGRAMRADDGELVAALAREANQQGWSNIIRQIRAEGSPAQQRGGETLSWAAEVRQHIQTTKFRFFDSARFSPPGVEGTGGVARAG